MSNMTSIMPLSHHRCLCITHRYPIRTFFSCMVNRGFEGETFPVFEEGVPTSLSPAYFGWMFCPTNSLSLYPTHLLCPITLHLNHMESLPAVWTFFHVATKETEGVWWEGVGGGK